MHRFAAFIFLILLVGISQPALAGVGIGARSSQTTDSDTSTHTDASNSALPSPTPAANNSAPNTRTTIVYVNAIANDDAPKRDIAPGIATTPAPTSKKPDAHDKNSASSQRPAQEASKPVPQHILASENEIPGETIHARVSRLDGEATNHFYSGAAQVATGITQFSIAEQGKSENGASPEVQQLLQQGLNNIGEGTNKLETGREIVAHANKIVARENSTSSIGASGRLAAIPFLTFDSEKADANTKEALKEMEQDTGVPASSLINAINQGAARYEIVSLAAGSRGAQLSETEIIAGMPTFAISSSPESYARPSTPSATPILNFTSAAKGLSGGSFKEKEEATPKERKIASMNNYSRAAARESDEELRSLGADNLLSSISGKSAEEEGSLFQRISKQYNKRFNNLGATASSAR